MFAVAFSAEGTRLETVAVELPQYDAPTSHLLRAQSRGTGHEDRDLQSRRIIPRRYFPQRTPLPDLEPEAPLTITPSPVAFPSVTSQSSHDGPRNVTAQKARSSENG